MNRSSHTFYMRKALELARRGEGKTSPNPMVGALLVKKGKIIARGFHRRAGTDHAEISALKKAGWRARGAVLYVTLEPCKHFGRTPPCVPAILRAGIRKVVYGMRDPHKVSGGGARLLKKAGVPAVGGVLRRECMELNRAFIRWATKKMPYVVLKAGLSLDGKIATQYGESRWITHKEARRYGQILRSRADAIIIGSRTLLLDNPRLSVRLGLNSKQPRIVILSKKPISLRGKNVLKTKGRRVEVASGRNLKGLLKRLAAEGVLSVLVEGGGKVSGSFIKAGLVDEVVACIAPKLVGGDGRDWLTGFSCKKLSKAVTLKQVAFWPAGDNILLRGRIR